MHVGAVAIFELAPLSTADGGLDVERIRKLVESRLHLIPRYRQRLCFTPISRRPVWIDDCRFNLDYHVRHTSLPRPGGENALKRLAGRIFSQHLDREKPLWEIWLVEGLAGDRFAMISKVHHCMVDGVAGVNLMGLLLVSERDAADATPLSWIPRTPPTTPGLAFEDLRELATRPLRMAGAIGDALRAPQRTWRTLHEGASALREAGRAGFRIPPQVPFNGRIGPHRLFEWHDMDLARIKEVKRALGGTVNDVVLSVVTGALRRFLDDRGVALEGLELRCVTPVNMRTGDADLASGNHVSGRFVSLPVGESDPLRRYAALVEQGRRLKEGRAAQGIELFSRLADWTGSNLLMQLGVELARAIHPYNLIVTNVPGPQAPLYMLGSEMKLMAPELPLFENQGLSVAVMSYHGRVTWGLTGDWDLVPDLASLCASIGVAFEELRRVAGVV